jgi:exonuclease III
MTELNINGCTSWTRLRMSDFVHRHEIDILFLQEVSTEVSHTAGYNTHLNIGDAGRGTAILAKEGLKLTG